jgi:hypothetical protein
MTSPIVLVSPRLMVGSVTQGGALTSTGSPLVGLYRAGVPQVVLDPNEGTVIEARVVRGNGDLSRPTDLPWSVQPAGGSPIRAADFMGGDYPSGVAQFAAGASEAQIQLTFAAGQPPPVARTARLVLGTPTWGVLDPLRAQVDVVMPHVLPPDEDLSLWQTEWVDPGTSVLDSWVLWGGAGVGAVVGYSGGGLRIFPGADPSQANQRTALWARTPLPADDWRIAFTYQRLEATAPFPPFPVTFTIMAAVRGLLPYPDNVVSLIGGDALAPQLPSLVQHLDGFKIAVDNLYGPDEFQHVVFELPGDVRLGPPSDNTYCFDPPSSYDMAIEKVGARLKVKWRPTGGAWEDYDLQVTTHTGRQWGFFAAPNRDCAISALSVSSYLGDVSVLLPFDPVGRYENYLDTALPVASEVRTVLTVAQLVAAHDTIAEGGHIVVPDGVTLTGDFDLARSAAPGRQFVLRTATNQGATLAGNIRIFGDGWIVRGFKETPRAGPVARIRIIDADRVRVSRIALTGQTGAFAVMTVEGDRPCSDIRIDRCTIPGFTTWGIAIIATADKNVQLDWNAIPGSLLSTTGGGILVGADSQANQLVLAKAVAFNYLSAIRAPYGILVRSSGAVYFRNTLARGAGSFDLVADNGANNFYVANDLSGGARFLLRGLKPILIGNRTRGTGATVPCCILYGGTYDPVVDGFEPAFPTDAQLQRLTGVAGLTVREAVSGALLASNDFEGLIRIGGNSASDAARPVPVRGASITDHAGPGTVSAGVAWDVGTQYRPLDPRPVGVSTMALFTLLAADAGVLQSDAILVAQPPQPVLPAPVRWVDPPGGRRSGKLWNNGPGLTWPPTAVTTWVNAVGHQPDVLTGGAQRSNTTGIPNFNALAGGPLGTNASYDNFAAIQNQSQLDWAGTNAGNAADLCVKDKTWLVWVMDTVPADPAWRVNAATDNTWQKLASSNLNMDDYYYAMGRRAYAVVTHYGLSPWQLMLRINHEMNQSNEYQVFEPQAADYATAMDRFITAFQSGYGANNGDKARMIFSPSRHFQIGPLKGFFTFDPVTKKTPYDVVDVSAHPAASLSKYNAPQYTYAQMLAAAVRWMQGGEDSTPGYAQDHTTAAYSMKALAQEFGIFMCNSEWSPRYEPTLQCEIADAVYEAMYNFWRDNWEMVAFECVFHSNTLSKAVAVPRWSLGVDKYTALWSKMPAQQVATTPGGTGPGPVTPGSYRSGLGFMSGMCDDTSGPDMMPYLHAWETFRSRLVDVSTQFFGRQHTSWTQLTDNFLMRPGALVEKLLAEGITPALTIAHFSSAMPGLSVAAAARGDYDQYHLAAAQKIAALGVKVFIRLGHECDDSINVWSYLYPGVSKADYIAMWRRHASIYLNTIGPDKCFMDWNHLMGAGQYQGDPMDFYPGDDVVQIIGADCYGRSRTRGDTTGYIVTDQDWIDWLTNKTPEGWPRGPQAWLEIAIAHGKKFAVAEWAVTNWMGPNTVADSARYIQGMYEFFNANAANIAYENYFNRIAGTAVGAGGHKILPSADNPRASTQYAASWASTISGSSYAFGAAFATSWTPKRGSATLSVVGQPRSDTVVLTAGATNASQAALYFWCKQRPATKDGTWAFYLTRLDANVHTDASGIGLSFIPSYVGAGGLVPADPNLWTATLFRPTTGEPAGDSILAQKGTGLRVRIDLRNEPTPALGGIVEAVRYAGGLDRPALTPQAGQVNQFIVPPPTEWRIGVGIAGNVMTVSADAPGQNTQLVVFEDPNIGILSGGFFGFRVDRGGSYQLRALTYSPG